MPCRGNSAPLQYRISMNKPLYHFFVRWLVCGLGLWIAAGLLGSGITYDNRLKVIVISGLILALINMIIRPIVVFLSLPAILISLGLFMLVVNGLMVLLASKLYTPLHVKNLWAAIFAGLI